MMEKMVSEHIDKPLSHNYSLASNNCKKLLNPFSILKVSSIITVPHFNL